MEATKRARTARVTHGGSFHLLDLAAETLLSIVNCVSDADLFFLAHAHTSLWAIIHNTHRSLKTPAVAVVSVGRLAWVRSLPAAAQPPWIRRWDCSTMGRLAASGHAECVWWARRNGCEWDEDTCYTAAKSGDLQLLQELRRQGCPWDHETYQIAKWKARGGCPDATKLFAWVQEQDCPERHPLAAIFGSPSQVPDDWDE